MESSPEEWFVAPVPSTSPLFATFEASFRPLLSAYFTGRSFSAFAHLLSLKIPTNREQLEIPSIVIFVSEGDRVNQVYDDVIGLLDPIEEFKGFVLSVADGEYSGMMEDDMQCKLYHTTAQSGVSIGFKNCAATTGPLLSTSNENYTITVAHLFTALSLDGKAKVVLDDGTGCKVTQPVYADFLEEKSFLEKSLARSRMQLGSASEAGKQNIMSRMKERQTRLDQLMALGANREEFESNAEFGEVVRFKYSTEVVCGRRRRFDYALLRITKREIDPGMLLWNIGPAPREGQLCEEDWENSALKRFGNMKFDLDVWKAGRGTGVTFGRVAGNMGVNYISGGDVTDEFWVLRDSSFKDWKPFASEGDSGSLVVSREGIGCGMVLGAWRSFGRAFRMPIDPSTRLWDLRSLPSLRRPDGNLDLSRTVSEILHRGVIIVSCMESILNDIRMEFTPVA